MDHTSSAHGLPCITNPYHSGILYEVKCVFPPETPKSSGGNFSQQPIHLSDTTAKTLEKVLNNILFLFAEQAEGLLEWHCELEAITMAID